MMSRMDQDQQYRSLWVVFGVLAVAVSLVAVSLTGELMWLFGIAAGCVWTVIALTGWGLDQRGDRR